MTKFEQLTLAAEKYIAELETFFGDDHGTTLQAKANVSETVAAAQEHPDATDEAPPAA